MSYFEEDYDGYDIENLNDEKICFDIDDIKQETEKAILVKLEKKSTSIWLPKSQIEYDKFYVWIPYWLAEKEGLA